MKLLYPVIATICCAIIIYSCSKDEVANTSFTTGSDKYQPESQNNSSFRYAKSASNEDNWLEIVQIVDCEYTFQLEEGLLIQGLEDIYLERSGESRSFSSVEFQIDPANESLGYLIGIDGLYKFGLEVDIDEDGGGGMVFYKWAPFHLCWSNDCCAECIITSDACQCQIPIHQGDCNQGYSEPGKCKDITVWLPYPGLTPPSDDDDDEPALNMVYNAPSYFVE